MHPNHNEKGIMMYIPVKNLESGYHMLEIMEVDQVTEKIHFWKY